MPQLGLGLGLHRANRALFRGLLDQYAGAAAAYSLRALSSGWLAGDVVEVRPSHGAAAQSFTASQITSGAMLDFVNNGTSDLYNSARYFNGTSAEVVSSSGVSDPNSDWTLSVCFNLSVMSTSNPDIISQKDGTGTGRSWLRARNGTLDTFFGGSSSVLKSGLVVGTSYTVTLSRSSGTISGTIDGGAFDNEALNVVSPTVESCDGQLVIGASKLSSAFSEGTIWNVNYNNEVAYTGLGTSVTAWEDTIGSNDGTESNGAAYTGQPFDGFVSTWYDQSGNANDAIQATTTAQPKIVSAGALVTGGLDFDGVNDRLTCSSMYSADLSVFATATTNNTVSTANYMRMFHICDGVDSFQITRGGGLDIGLLCSKNTSFQAGIDAFKHGAINGENLITTITSAIETDAYVDDSLGSNSATDLGSGNSAITTIGARDDLSASSFFAGSFAEIIIYNTDQSANRTAIEANINAAYTIYA